VAKNNHPGPERSRVRIVFIEGDLAPGDLKEITQALTNAVRPTPAAPRVFSPPRIASPSLAADTAELSEEVAEQVFDDDEDRESSSTNPQTKRPSKPRKYRSPEAVDLDFKSGSIPWAQFASQKGPESHRARYLVACAWLAEHAGIKTATANHVFTCYKGAGWTFDIQDPTVTFRQLKGEQLGVVSKGSFTINHLGIAEVEKLKAS
jgi:hypothetical protein